MFSLIIFLKLFNVLWRLLWILLRGLFLVGDGIADHFEVQMLGENVLHEIDTHKGEALLFIWIVKINTSENQYLADSILLLTIDGINWAAELVFDI